LTPRMVRAWPATRASSASLWAMPIR
jgi:hypothetical protein